MKYERYEPIEFSKQFGNFVNKIVYRKKSDTKWLIKFVDNGGVVVQSINSSTKLRRKINCRNFKKSWSLLK